MKTNFKTLWHFVENYWWTENKYSDVVIWDLVKINKCHWFVKNIVDWYLVLTDTNTKTKTLLYKQT